MNIFISWSGGESKLAAELIRDWITNVLQAVIPFVSSEDIDRGAPWFNTIGETLENSDFGILCVTPTNKTSPWIMFEAGAISKKVSRSNVIPLLIGIKPTELVYPLALFNAATTEKAEFYKVLTTINSKLGDRALSDEKLKSAYEKWWSDFDEGMSEILKKVQANEFAEEKSDVPTESSKINEILELARYTAAQVNNNNHEMLDKIGNLLNAMNMSYRRPSIDDSIRTISGEGSLNIESVKTSSDLQKSKNLNALVNALAGRDKT